MFELSDLSLGGCMTVFSIISLVCWTIVGVLELMSEKVSKLIYFLTWLMLMMYLLTPFIEEVV
jgi:hypothetical protein